MKLEGIPVAWPKPNCSELSEYDLFEYYDGYLGLRQQLQKLYFRTEEIPDIVVEAAAFRLGCIDHETCMFGWCPWEIDDPDHFALLRRFIERTGQNDLAQEVLNFEEKLLQFGVENVRLYFSNNVGQLSPALNNGINDVVVNGFDHSKFGEDIWLKTALIGAELVEDGNVLHRHYDVESLTQSLRALVNKLPDYESRILYKPTLSWEEPFFELLTQVGERYYTSECVKIARGEGHVSLYFDAHKYEKLTVFEEASKVSLMTSTEREWLCCQIGNTVWLVEPTTGEKRASAPAPTGLNG